MMTKVFYESFLFLSFLGFIMVHSWITHRLNIQFLLLLLLLYIFLLIYYLNKILLFMLEIFICIGNSFFLFELRVEGFSSGICQLLLILLQDRILLLTFRIAVFWRLDFNISFGI